MKNISRRDFLKGTIAGAATLAASSLMGTAALAENAEESWDYEAELVTIGSGTVMFGVMEALHQGHTVVILEKNGMIGGTTAMSGGTWWVPNNHKEGKDGIGADVSEDEVMEYLRASDTYNGATDEMRLDYLRNAPKVFEYVETAWNQPIGACVGKGDYYNLPGHVDDNRRLMRFLKEDGSFGNGSYYFSDIFQPALEEYADQVTVLTDTPATALIQDGTGKVIGVRAQQKDGTEIRVKATAGVIMATGSFDRNEDMCRKYLRGPLYGSLVSSGCTGDGIIMGMEIGADLDNMSSTLDGTCFDTEEETDGLISNYDWGTYRGMPYSMIVNKKGRRFANESASYGVFTDAMYNFDHKYYGLSNIPGYLIFSDAHVEMAGWPTGADTQPDFVKTFDDLDSLAAEYGIEADALKEEVEKFNGYCETGVDLDYARGDGVNESNNYQPVEGLANMCLGPVTAPYYVVKVLPSSIGTNGGLKINPDAQVINVRGNVIEGLYACGCNAANPFGSSYTGGGASVGPGMYQAFRAVNHIFDMGII